MPKSHGLEIADALIAAIAMTKAAIVHTGNIHDFLYIEELDAKVSPTSNQPTGD